MTVLGGSIHHPYATPLLHTSMHFSIANETNCRILKEIISVSHPPNSSQGYLDSPQEKYKIQKHLCVMSSKNSWICGHTAGLLLPQEISHFPPHFNTARLSSPHFPHNFNFHFSCESFAPIPSTHLPSTQPPTLIGYGATFI